MNFTAEAQITMNAGAEKVWNAITDPALVKQYMFGADMTADWKKGGRIVYRGEWQGKPYEDGGIILEIEPQKKLVTTYFSSVSGKEDIPENYNVITYALSETDGKTTLRVTQENNSDQAAADQSSQNWQGILESMQALVEA